MMRGHSLVTICLVLGLAGCAASKPFPQAAFTLPPIAADRGRIFFYSGEPPGRPSLRSVFLNGEQAGVVIHGRVFYLDLAAATYNIAVASHGGAPQPMGAVLLHSDQTIFLKIKPSNVAIDAPDETMIVGPAEAESELAEAYLVDPFSAVISRTPFPPWSITTRP